MVAMFASVDDVAGLFRPLSPEEARRAEALIPVVEDSLRQEAKNRGRDLDLSVSSGALLSSVLKSVIVDVVSRTLMTSTTGGDPVSQFTQSALGYSVSGTYLNPGGGLFIKNSELKRLGLNRQVYGGIELYAD